MPPSPTEAPHLPAIPASSEDAPISTASGSGEEAARILDALPAMVGYWDRGMRNRHANRVYKEFFGRDPEDIHGRHISELLGPELYELNRPYIERALAGEPQLFDRALVDSTGTPRYTQASYIPDIVDGEVRGLIAMVTDITARRVAEQAHVAAEDRFRGLIEAAPDAVVIVDADGRIVLVNAQTERLFGYRREELLGEPMEMLIPEHLHERHRAHRREYVQHPTTRVLGPGLELAGRRKDGSEFPVEISVGRLVSADGVLISSAIRDITPRKQVEDELRRSNERLAEAERVARIGSWEWDLAADEISWSDGLYALYGMTRESFDSTFAGARTRVYPDDWELVSDTFERAIAHRSSFALEYRAIRTDGRVRTFRSHGDIVVDDDGRPTRLVGIVQDITDAKLAQDTLQTTSATLARQADELQRLAVSGPRHGEDPSAHAPLSARQLEILRLIAQGLTNAAIAERLVVTEGTVKWHVRQILAKTNTSNRAEAIARVLGTPA